MPDPTIDLEPTFKFHRKAQTALGRKFRFVFASMWFGGTKTVFRNLRDAISRRDDVEATWIQVGPEPEEFIGRIPPVSWNWTLRGSLVVRSRIRALERAGHSFDAAYFNDHIPPSFLGRFRDRVPSVIAMDVTPLLLDKYRLEYGVPSSAGKHPIEWLKFRWTQKTYMASTFLLPWTRWVRNSLVNDYAVEEEKIRVLPPGIDLSIWNSQQHNAGRKVGAGEKIRILFVGEDFRRKGGHLICKVAKNEAFANCEFHLVTKGRVDDHAENIIVHPALSANSKDLIDLYRRADIFLLPTNADLFPISILEAMAMGLPVVSTNIGAINEMITEGKTGFVIPVNDEHALADRLARLVSDDTLRFRLGENARKAAVIRFDLESYANVVVEHLIKAATMNGRMKEPRRS